MEREEEINGDGHIEDEDKEVNKMKEAAHVLFDTLMECMDYIKENHDPLREKKKFKDIIMDKVRDKYKTEFVRWFGESRDDHNNSVLESKFKRYILECLMVCRGIHKYKLQLFPTRFIKDDNDEDREEEQDQDENVKDEGAENEFRFVIEDILNHCDIMERDDLFDATPIDGKWYCSFPGIIIQDEDDEDLDEKQLLDVINEKKQSKYKLFASKLWMFQAAQS